MMKIKKVICMQCHNACRLASEVQGHHLVSVEPDETFPGTKSSYPITKGAEPSLHGVWKSNCNMLTDDDPDICNPISGGWPLRTLLCKVTKA
jgi:hypothetical protein